jgi:hypothetical protein
MRRALRFLFDGFFNGIEEVGRITVESLIEGLRMAPCQSGRPPTNVSNYPKQKCIEVVLRIHGIAA